MIKIRVRNQFPLIHCWPQAPYNVAYLRDAHRHMMHVTTEMEVFHDDREIEFILVKEFINRQIDAADFPIRISCEQIAKWLIKKLEEKYGERYIQVTVEEDGENGAIVDNKEDN